VRWCSLLVPGCWVLSQVDAVATVSRSSYCKAYCKQTGSVRELVCVVCVSGQGAGGVLGVLS
jgi:hypothetical protein